MATRVSGKRYAQAIFELAVEHDQADQWAEDLGFASQVLQDGEFSAFLKHAEVSAGDKTKAIDAVLPEIHPLVRNLVALLVTRGSVDVAGDVHRAYLRLLDDYRGRQQVEVTSAVPLDSQELENIQKFVSDLVRKEVVITARVDESILGGVIIQVGDQLLDGSTRSRLEALRGQLRTQVAAPAA